MDALDYCAETKGRDGKKEIFRLFGRSLERVRMSDDYAS